jgi:crotonobetainyl-CoA:carnitine CoA-transferase CaiB-like acyl-CoA transferase
MRSSKDSWICLSAKTNAQAFAIFAAIGKPELKDDPRFNTVANRFNAGFFQTVEHATEGTIRNMRLPNKTSFNARRKFMGAPKRGQHSVDVLRDAGLDEAQISALGASGAIIDGRLDNAR